MYICRFCNTEAIITLPWVSKTMKVTVEGGKARTSQKGGKKESSLSDRRRRRRRAEVI